MEAENCHAFSLISGLIQKAKSDIILIDGYVDTGTLDLLSKKKTNVTVSYTNAFQDRFLILDHKTGYHIGASIKDAGKKCFAISVLEDPQMIRDILNRL